ncbi:hypothetical protein [Candidatus Uabimicrobium sp. HlEnr_7]|uniref:hypothetical protein n=1 Tax=Candidatus Uabimicrobium helgolandensis TaxID=3095367 RepID=UPI0035584402
MDWEYNEVQNEHSLMSGGSKIAAIQIKAMENSEKFKVKTIIDIVYYGYKKQLLMEKKSKDWICHRKKVRKSDLDRYVNVKKTVVKKFIESREKEA